MAPAHHQPHGCLCWLPVSPLPWLLIGRSLRVLGFVFIIFVVVVCSVATSHLSRYELPQYGSRRKLISPSGLYDEYGEVVVDDDGSYYYSPQEPDAEVEETTRFFAGGS